MKIVLILMISAYSLLGWTQREKDWRRGVLVLSCNQVITGPLYLVGFETVLHRADASNLVQVFSAHSIKQIRFYDAASNINRKFITIKERTEWKQAHKLYELVLDGKMAIVRRPAVENQSMSVVNDHGDYSYFVKTGTDIVDLSKFRERYFNDLLKTSFGLEAFVESQKLNPNSEADAIRIIQFCNGQLPKAVFTSLN
jgi:endonuclease/exonuclease/phosphatase (EEP) superfamily protein YafD